MASLALPSSDLFSIVTTASRSDRSPSWKSLFDWPAFGDTHVDYAADTATQRNIWAARLDEAVLRADKPVLLVASGDSCFATAWWARLSPSSYVSRVAGALLFKPPGGNASVESQFASPRVALPFPSAIVSAKSSRGALDRRVLALAENWGSGFLDVERDALASPDAGPWQQAQNVVMRLTASIVERDIRLAEIRGL